ncbi:hypothetical protein SAMN05216532_7368 [Streptomyces sp. 2231.1]|nr:hypothetical protein SAMN05216532_7368 [Streptomyces sp. 2231.1]
MCALTSAGLVGAGDGGVKRLGNPSSDLWKGLSDHVSERQRRHHSHVDHWATNRGPMRERAVGTVGPLSPYVPSLPPRVTACNSINRLRN